MSSQPLLGALLLALFFAPGNGSRVGRPTNFEILGEQVDSLSASLARVLQDESVRAVSLQTGKRTVDGFVRQRLIERFIQDKLLVSSDTASAAVVRVSVPLVRVDYTGPVASHIFGSPDVVRTMRAEYDVEISGGGQVRFAKSFNMAFKDTVSESEIPSLEAGSYDFLRGKVESKNLFDTVLQPVLFVASAAVIVYLFFTLRGS